MGRGYGYIKPEAKRSHKFQDHQRQKREEENFKAEIKEEKRVDGSDLSSLKEALLQEQLMAMPKQQTAVSKTRRSIFKLPVSSSYTQYYPPESEGDIQTDQVQLEQVEKTQETSTSSKGRGKIQSSSNPGASRREGNTMQKRTTDANPGASVSQVKPVK